MRIINKIIGMLILLTFFTIQQPLFAQNQQPPNRNYTGRPQHGPVTRPSPNPRTPDNYRHNNPMPQPNHPLKPTFAAPPNMSPMPDVPPMPPLPPAMHQDFPVDGMSLNLGNIQIDGINLSGNSGVMPGSSGIEVAFLGKGAADAEAARFSLRRRFIAISNMYEIKARGTDRYFGLPVKYAIMANTPMPSNSRVYMLVCLGDVSYFIPATTTTAYGMVISEINSCAIYDRVCLVADTAYGYNQPESFLMASSLDSYNRPANPHYAYLSDEDGFNMSVHLFPNYGKSSGGFSNFTTTIIQPSTSSSLDICKINNGERIYVQTLPFTLSGSYSFCQIDLSNFQHDIDDKSFSFGMFFSFENTNLEDIPEALIFRTTCQDAEGISFATEDLMVYINLAELQSYNSPFASGSGTRNNPFVITSVSQLDKVRDFPRRYFSLRCNLDMSSYNNDWLSLGNEEEPFNGLFEGNSHTIYGLSINQPEENYQGLFGCIRNGSVKNLKVQLSPSGIVGKDYCGILSGYASNARIYQCHANGSIKGTNYIGGIIGYSSNNTTIRKSIAECTASSEETGATVGGMIGYAEDTTITDSFTAADVTAVKEESSIGGIIAQGERTKLQNCYSTGTISGGRTGYAGGLIGYMADSEMKGCIAINKRINGGNQGRLAGATRGSSFTRCFAWEYIRDINNKYVSEGGFGGYEATQETRNGESIAKNNFYTSGTRNKFWTVNKKVGFNLNSWIFNKGYDLPQLRGMNSVANPDYLR